VDEKWIAEDKRVEANDQTQRTDTDGSQRLETVPLIVWGVRGPETPNISHRRAQQLSCSSNN